MFTFSAENLVCRNVEIIGSVILVQTSSVSILGITDRASRLSESRCATAVDIIFLECLVSASVNSKRSPVALPYPSMHAQFLPIQSSGLGFADTGTTLECLLANSEIMSHVASSDESSIAMTS